MKSYNTNLAAEFHVLSMLHRLGVDANLTLGNKKSVDIAVVLGAGQAITIDMKGLAGITSWPVDNVDCSKRGHFLVFVCFKNKIAEPSTLPEIWVVPSDKVEPLIYTHRSGRRFVQRSTLRGKAEKFRDAWHYFIRDALHNSQSHR